MPTFRMTYPTAVVLQALEAGLRYGFEIADTVGLRPGSVYQVLRRLEDAGFVLGEWEAADEARDQGRPARRYYVLQAGARDALQRARETYPARIESTAISRESPA